MEVAILVGAEWQAWADQLLSRHYGPTEYQKVPAKDGGDAGIEGFVHSKGHVFQCYGCEEPVSVDKRYENHRDKMTLDIKKFIDNRKKLGDLFGSTKIRRWCLFVPVHDSKRIVVHATVKTEEVKAAKLPYVEDDFRVVVMEEKDFAKERDELTAIRPGAIDVVGDSSTNSQVTDWAEQNDPLVAKIDGKIRLLPTIQNPQRQVEFRNDMIRHFLDGQNVLRALQKSYPTSYDRVVRIKSGKEKYLRTSSSIATGNPADILTKTIRGLHEAVLADKCGVSSATAEAVTYEAVADWLLRCPLDFPEKVQT